LPAFFDRGGFFSLAAVNTFRALFSVFAGWAVMISGRFSLHF
jgi:hypothetical protein